MAFHWSAGQVDEALALKASAQTALRRPSIPKVGSAYGAIGSVEGNPRPVPIVGVGVALRQLSLRYGPGSVHVLGPVIYHSGSPSSELRLLFDLQAVGQDLSRVTLRRAAPPHSFATQRQRPVWPGLSIGHYRITAGTLGGVVRRGDDHFYLSNNHVFAATNQAALGDPILQPGPLDGGLLGRNQVATFSSTVPLDWMGPNYIDGALATPSVASSKLQWGQVSVRTGYRAAPADLVGMLVEKCGRTTDYTSGQIESVATDIDAIDYGDDPSNPGPFASFENQIVVRGIGRDFSAGGDSGSLVWSRDARLPGVGAAGRAIAVGLLFAGAPSGETYLNPWLDVELGLGITLA